MHTRGLSFQQYGLALLIFSLSTAGIYTLELYLKTAGDSHIFDTPILASNQDKKLPVTWNTPRGQYETRHFFFEFPISELPSDPLLIYFPRYEQRLKLKLNNHPFPEELFRHRWTGPRGTATNSVEIPAHYLVAGKNQLEVEITTGPHIFGSLSPFMIGEKGAITLRAALRSFVEYELKIILFTTLLLIGLLSIIFVAAEGREKSFLWLGYTMITASAYSIGAFEPIFPGVIEWLPPLLSLSLVSALCLLGFLYHYLGLPPPRLLAASILTIGAAGFLIMWSGAVAVHQFILGFTLPLSTLVLLFSLFLIIHHTWQTPTVDRLTILSGLFALAIAVIHDIALRQGALDSIMLWSPITRSLLLAGIAIFMMQRHATHSKEVALFSSRLQTRLTEKESELHAAFKREQALSEAAATEKERERITLELHDGVASQLATIIALSENDQQPDTSRSIRENARHALQDLRLVIDTLSDRNSDLLFTIASFRQYCLNPVEKMGIGIEYAVYDLPNIDHLTPETALNIIRILQEGLSNALRHGAPDTIRLYHEIHGDKLRLILENCGGVTVSDSPKGYGLENMSKRAEQIGGKAWLEPIEGGARLILQISQS